MSRIAIAVTVVALLATGCISLDRAPPCGPGEQVADSESIYFGTGKPAGGIVSPDEWTSFLSESVTPRFPAGLTVWPSTGQWRGADGRIVREDSYVLNLLHGKEANVEADIRAVIQAYIARFGQEAVLRVRTRACMALVEPL
jgi:hypothetical protein